MGVSLAKGGNVSLTKEAPNLTKALIGLGWDARTTSGQGYASGLAGIAKDFGVNVG
jgi:tellurium resistance protein TerD